jgi:predicted amidohydrolase
VKVGYLQFEVQFGEPATNRRRVEELLGDEKFDILILPELCFSGYFMPSREETYLVANEHGQGDSFDFIRDIAARHNGMVVYGFPERAHDHVFNSCAAVMPDGSSYLYRKVHLFNLEKQWFEPGDRGFDVFEFRGAKIGMMICFDWIFPEAARTLALKGAEIICHPSNLVLQYCQKAMTTRSIENGVFTITCNRIGTDRQGEQAFTFTGNSQITDTRGEVLVRSPASTEDLVFVDIDPMAARDKRITEHNDVLDDRRPDSYV